MDSTTATEPPSGRPARLGGMLRATLRGLLDVGLPPLCPACRDPGALCAACWSRLHFIGRPYCERLGIPFAYDPGPGVLSMQALADPPAYGRARAALRFDDVARSLVHALKYGDRLDLAPMLGRWMAKCRSGAARRRGRARAGAAALAAPVGAALQSVRRARQLHFGGVRCPGQHQLEAGPRNAAAGRAWQVATGPERPGRLSRSGHRPGRSGRPAPRSGR